MPSTTNFKKWEIILVPFPFTDLSSVKRRPAIIVSPDSYNIKNDVVIAYVTSQLSASTSLGDYRIQKWKEAGLPKPSMVRMKFATVTKNIIIKTIGKLETEDKKNLRKLF
jgi:mRNA interferase MazF